mgnify:CR=1 FL=1
MLYLPPTKTKSDLIMFMGGGGTLPQKNKNKEQKITQKTTLCITERAIIISCIKPIKNKSKKTHMI